ncbi:hypothetical protein C2G38_2180678 [Gigaspora rosea]|uniref:Endonuclease/exonuclease/phosphatase n=1 Tax=Gigaspora rosea TaxID=44941 RepID=A0A397VBN1_9GLOM|nr:hypothetical protein C2G38_2180678 [Gigaspora rosea]
MFRFRFNTEPEPELDLSSVQFRSTLIYAPTPRFTEEAPVVQQTNNENISQPFLFQNTQILNLASTERTIDDNALGTDNQQSPSGFGNQKPFERNPAEPLKIITHNVRGINNTLKFQLFLEHYVKERAHIVAITETKLSQSRSSTHALINPLYKIYMANCNKQIAKTREFSMGTAIAVHPDL